MFLKGQQDVILVILISSLLSLSSVVARNHDIVTIYTILFSALAIWDFFSSFSRNSCLSVRERVIELWPRSLLNLIATGAKCHEC